MIALTPSLAAELLGATLEPGTPPTAAAELTDAVVDSRKVRPGSLFVALPGDHVDGHDYVATAHAAGAAAALVSRLVPGGGPQILVSDPAAALGTLARHHLAGLRERAAAAGRPFDVVAVTGSVGKTTTKDLLAALLGELGEVVAPVASFNNEIGLPLTVLSAGEQTRTLVLEMGADAPGNLTYLTSIAPPDLAIVLKVGRAHLQGFGSIEGVARAKAELVEGLRPGGVALLNLDDPRVAAMAGLTEHVRTFGESPEADFRATHVRTDDDGRASFTLTGRAGGAAGATSPTEVSLALVGEHHVVNGLAAAAAALLLGLSADAVAARLARTGPASAHRMHLIDTAGGIRIVDDAYNANPESVRAALKALAAMSVRAGAGRERRRTIAVLGEMRELGPDSIGEHDAIGRLAVRLNIDKLLVVGEGARPIHTGAVQEGSWGAEAAHVDTIEEALTVLLTELRPGDIVLLKSSNGAGLARLADRLVADLAEVSAP
ncbi:UDP-N-acetylmuramoyl-tripeptide--D-alanyl-D-alanine ligase [Pseudactinotalea sp. HY158]|uniref:UDP-N-acetylmuramoyl-tripeptide--D-alanyl-D- alanine ligase n=1 Tax=Pseudactinotalea sp. HY158 TaxID=2654547 RepID=UPI00129C567C|nr:UDP-N-acetylmuramoyl-tripeptide--D-alanyl-D-alanine ligase [Pseudactinotalea sp. HY158]QGH69833.1 UDP-N-acetylmuramoyl-tripeptide--D-alanyl-D-alanine ligase [Pseudactinotalea sp. HY158]